MSFEQLKLEVARLNEKEQAELISYTLQLRYAHDDAHRREVADRFHEPRFESSPQACLDRNGCMAEAHGKLSTNQPLYDDLKTSSDFRRRALPGGLR